VAVALAAPLDLMASQRIVAPGQENETLGAVTPDRTLIVNRALVDRLGLSEDTVEVLSIPAWSEAQRSLSKYRGNRAQIELRGRTVVLVDDGITTGYTMMAAVISTRKLEPARIMVAVPVAALEAIERVSAAVDDLLALEISVETDFSVERFYQTYETLADRDVIWTLENLWRERPPAGYSETF
jgi:putative phosphoribosyl transferase